MSVQLVTLEQGKRHLLVDHDADDADITDKIEMASDLILSYLKLYTLPPAWGGATGASDTGTGETTGETGTPGTGVPKRIQAATLLVLAELYKNREASEINMISIGVEALLIRDRDPAMA